MSVRNVMIGPNDGRTAKIAEVPPMDAAAFLADGNWRVCLALFDGPLANATVLVRTREWGKNPRANDLAWESAMLMCPDAIQGEIDLPLTLADYGASAETAALKITIVRASS